MDFGAPTLIQGVLRCEMAGNENLAPLLSGKDAGENCVKVMAEH